MGTERLGANVEDGSLSRSRLWWGAFGLVLLGILVWIGYRYVGWVVFGVFTYYVSRPITRRLQRYVSSWTIAATMTLAFILVPILLFVVLFLGVALNQALQILSSDLATEVLNRLQVPVTTLPSDPIELAVVLVSDPTYATFVNQFGGILGVFTTTLFNAFLSLIFAFFLLVEDGRLSRWFEANVFGSESLSVAYLRSVDQGLTSVYFGYTLTIFVVIILSAIIYSLFNLLAPAGVRIPYAMLLAVVTGVFTLIPLVGRSIVYVFIVGIMAVQAATIDVQLLWIPALFFASMVLVFDNVVRTYIRPYLSGKSYHMALVMFAYLLGPVLFGWYGIFMGPLLMVVVVEFVTQIVPRFAHVEPSVGPAVLPDVEPGDSSSGEQTEPTDVDRGESPTG
ncbi:AI-2E family transporter [Haloferax sp. YSSS75]|uniref:AI-2E family transporter n=1 Tax=Haloferax sp. YSSS75 TaxID=3388564 RepID=UPI00398CFEEB